MDFRRRHFFQHFAILAATGALASGGLFAAGRAMAATPNGVKALVFDVFGTLVDWRTSVARESRALLEPLGHQLDWIAFADVWRAEYQPSMEEVRVGRIPFSRLDIIHR